MQGCGVGIDALPSPISAPAINPPLITSSGLTPKNAGFHSTRSEIEHRTINAGLRRRNRCVAVTHQRAGYQPALDYKLRLDTKERRLPQHEIRDRTSDDKCRAAASE